MQGSEQTPKAPLGNNARPLQQLHHRTIRTNIDFNKVRDQRKIEHMIYQNFPYNQNQQQNCPSMYKEMYYKANKWSPELLSVGRSRDFDSVLNSYKNHN